MRRSFLLGLVLLSAAALAPRAESQEIFGLRWVKSLDAAKTLAAKADAPIFVYVYLTNNKACLALEKSVFTDLRLRLLVQFFVKVRLEATRDAAAVEALGVKRQPAIVLLDSAGEKIYVLEENLTAKSVLNMAGRAFLVSEYRSGLRARQSGNIRGAIIRFRLVVALGPGTPAEKWSRTQLQQIGVDGVKKLSQAKIALDEKDYAKAMPLLDDLAYHYVGTNVGKEARDLLVELKSNRDAAAALAEADRRRAADHALTLAQQTEKAGNLEAALIAYWDISRSYPSTPGEAAAKARADELAKNAELAAKATKTRMDRDVHLWTEMAENLVASKQKSKAVEYYKQILKYYPDTPAAKKAQDAIDGIIKK
jgi:TolA-binding protein